MDMSDEQFCFRTGLLKLAYSYARMVALSYAFQHAFGKAGMDENPFLTRVSVDDGWVDDRVDFDHCYNSALPLLQT